ncbi:MAG: hypothetical protein HZB92_08840 [Euryarchaeota archaeon]|nr:hypothetical protein [Euryarchaeota archaeon]
MSNIRKVYLTVATILVAIAMLSLAAMPAAADQNVTTSINATGTAKFGFGNGGGGGRKVPAEFHFTWHTSIPTPVPEEGFPAYVIIDGVEYQKNITGYAINVTAGTIVVTFFSGEILSGTVTNYTSVSPAPFYYYTTADITLTGHLRIDRRPYTMNLVGTYVNSVWPLSGGGGPT